MLLAQIPLCITYGLGSDFRIYSGGLLKYNSALRLRVNMEGNARNKMDIDARPENL